MQAKGHKTASVVIRGRAAESILAAAKEYNPDIIALGSEHYSLYLFGKNIEVDPIIRTR